MKAIIFVTPTSFLHIDLFGQVYYFDVGNKIPLDSNRSPDFSVGSVFPEFSNEYELMRPFISHPNAVNKFSLYLFHWMSTVMVVICSTLLRTGFFKNNIFLFTNLLISMFYFNFLFFGWEAALKLTAKIRLLSPKDNKKYEADELDSIVSTVFFSHILPVTCKERAAAFYTLAILNGFKPILSIGASIFPVHFHSWCICCDEIYADDATNTLLYHAVFQICG